MISKISKLILSFVLFICLAFSVSAVNTPPVLDLSGQAITLNEDDIDGENDAVNLLEHTTDAEGDPLSFFIISESNIDLVDASIEGTFLDVGVPAANGNGVSEVCIKAYDGVDYSLVSCLDVNVIAVNDAPDIDSYSPLVDPIIKVGTSIAFGITASDIDAGDTLSTAWYVNDVAQAETTNSFSYSNLAEGIYIIKVEVSDNSLEVAQHNWTLTISSLSGNTKFIGTIMQLTNDELVDATGVTIEQTTYGIIDFGDEVLDLTNVIDLDNNVMISPAMIGINTAVYPQLNKPATLTMKGLSFTNPVIYATSEFTSNPNDITASCSFCHVQSYSDGILTFTVDHFSTFKAIETPEGGVTPPPPGDTPTTTPVEDSELTISDLDVEVDDETDKNLDDGETISDEAEPGAVVKLNIEVENNYDFDLEDIKVEAILHNIGEDDDDIEEESDEFDLDDGDKEEVTLTFDIPVKVEDEEYTITIYVRGDDKNNTRYSLKWTIYLDVEKEKHNVMLSKAYLSPITIRCENFASLDVEVTNIGRNDEDEVVIEARSPDIELNFKRTEIELEEDIDDDDNDYRETINFALPSDLEEGMYPIVLKAYYDIDRQSDSKTLNLVKEQCKRYIEPEDVDVKYVTPTPFLQPTSTIDTEEGLSFDSMILLIVVGIIVIGLAVYGIGYIAVKS